jgi:hypothetical protein
VLSLTLMREVAVIEKTTNPSTKITMDAEELAALVKHSEQSMFWWNMPRRHDQFHRCLSMRVIDYPEPEIRFELQDDNRVVATVTHKVADLFNLLPRLLAMLELYDIMPQIVKPTISKETATELYSLLTGLRISETLSDGVNDFLAALDREIHA